MLGKWVLAALFALAAGGCATSPRVPDDATRQMNEILDRVSRHYSEEGARTCLPTSAYRRVEVIDERRLVFFGGGERAWLNDLRRPCNGLRPKDLLSFDLRDGRACRLDQIRAVDRYDVTSISGPSCALGDFKPIPPGQAEVIKTLIKER